MFIRLFSIYMYRNDVCSNLIIGHNLSIGHNTLSDKNSSDKIVEISAWCRKFCPTKNFVRRKFCPMFQYKSQAKIGQKCRNFGLVSKILSDEIFCPSKILSDEILSDKVCCIFIFYPAHTIRSLINICTPSHGDLVFIFDISLSHRCCLIELA